MSGVIGNYSGCTYEFIGKVPNSQIDELKKQGIVLEQNHLTLINYIRNFTTGILLGDGVFTKLSNLKIIIQARDCIPLLVLGHGFYGGVHISWRNLYLGIYKNMFQIFNRENIAISNLQFVIGPHVRAESMEYNRESLWKSHECYSEKAFIHSQGKTFLSMECLLTTALVKNGIKPKQILSTGINTYTNENYASYRRDGLNSSFTNIFTLIGE